MKAKVNSKDIFRNTFILLSAELCLLLISKADIVYLIICFLLGLIVGLWIIHCLKTVSINKNVWFWVTVLLGVLNAYIISGRFFKTWEPSGLMHSVIGRAFSNYTFGLHTLSYFLAILTIPFFVCFVYCIFIPFIKAINVNWKTVWKEIKKNISLHNFLKRLLIIAGCLFAAAFTGSILLFLAYLIPIQRIENNVAKSAKIIQEEGVYPKVSSYCTSQLDNFTDSLIMLESANQGSDLVLVEAMNNSYGKIDELNPADVLVRHYLQGAEFTDVQEYARYWHGNLIILKPLLYIFDYGKIRLINAVVQVLLVGVLLVLMIKKGLRGAIIPVLLSYLMLMPVAIAKSLQFSACFYIFIISAIVLLQVKRERLSSNVSIIFLLIGAATAYFDFLTFPITTFGVPALFCLLLTSDSKAEKQISDVLFEGLYWVIGFAGMWISKWILASFITGENVFAEGVGSLLFRTSHTSPEGSTTYSTVECIINNLNAFFKTPGTYLVITYIFVIIILLIRESKKHSLKNSFKHFLPFAVISITPIIWWALTVNHSSIHTWFTNKSAVVLLLGVLFELIVILQNARTDIPMEEGNVDVS